MTEQNETTQNKLTSKIENNGIKQNQYAMKSGFVENILLFKCVFYLLYVLILFRINLFGRK